ncbi:MAG: TIR domain-containing protein [Steroidobacteraceae bacterium]
MSARSTAVFISYASQDAEMAQRICAALRQVGLEVWIDQSELRGGDAWDASIRRQIRECALFIPLISSNTNTRSEGYFRLEWKLAVDRTHLMADDQPFLLPLVIDDTPDAAARVPDLFRERQWMRLHRGQLPPEIIERLVRLLALSSSAASPVETGSTLPGSTDPPQSAALKTPGRRAESMVATSQRLGVCVLPFANMSGDPEQEYFSDGITEDVITDLSKISALWVAARNTAFAFKGKNVDVLQVARQLKASHVLEGSVRKAGRRVRITAQLIDGASGGHVWAERYDRDLDDIFAVQDQISEAIVAALKLKLLPEEKKAIEQRDTTNPEAYKLYLMARHSLMGNVGAARSSDAIIRLCQRATQIDPNYARAWALMAWAQGQLRLMTSKAGDGGLAAAERALALNPRLAEAHAAKVRVLTADAKFAEAKAEIESALELDAESYEVNFAAARWCVATRNHRQAISFFEKATSETVTDFYAAGMLPTCYLAVDDPEGARVAARRAVERCERAVAIEPDNGSAMGFLVTALGVLGENERMKEWIERAVLLDPENLNMRYNFACVLIEVARDNDAGLDMLAFVLERCHSDVVNWVQGDADLDPVRDHARFRAMLAAAQTRLGLSPPLLTVKNSTANT